MRNIKFMLKAKVVYRQIMTPICVRNGERNKKGNTAKAAITVRYFRMDFIGFIVPEDQSV